METSKFILEITFQSATPIFQFMPCSGFSADCGINANLQKSTIFNCHNLNGI